jgi:hypothetical protein
MVMSGSRAPRPAHLLRALLLGVATVTASVALLVPGAPVASAHDELVASTPAEGATVEAPDAVALELSSPAQPLGTRVVVTAPDGAASSEGEAELRGATVVQPLVADLPPGVHTVSWQVTSSDGHPLTGSFSFTVAAPAEPAGSVGSTTAAAPAGAQDVADPPAQAGLAGAVADGSSATSGIAVGAGLVLVAAIGVAVRQLRRRA